MTLTELKESIAAVVAYNWADEERDYQECLNPDNENSAEGHIFEHLLKLAQFIGVD